MIAGTIVLVDTTLQFMNKDEGSSVMLTVCDSVTGISASREVDAADLAKGLGLALDPEGGDTSNMEEKEYEALVERLTPGNPLRWLP